MFGLGTVELLIVAVAILLEVPLFWAAASLADVPPMSWGKLIPVVLGVTLVWALLVALVGSLFPMGPALLVPENRPALILLVAIVHTVAWAVPAVLYIPLLSLSISRGMLVSVFQLLLRGFLYVLLIAVFMVVLALLQISSGSDVRGELPCSPLPGLVLSFVP